MKKFAILAVINAVAVGVSLWIAPIYFYFPVFIAATAAYWMAKNTAAVWLLWKQPKGLPVRLDATIILGKGCMGYYPQIRVCIFWIGISSNADGKIIVDASNQGWTGGSGIVQWYEAL